MALSQRTVEISNQENFHAKITTKTVAAAKVTVSRRPALGDVKLSEANKLSNLNNHASSVVLKKGNVMGPPQALPKKTVSSAVPKKTNTTKEETTKTVIKRQESILKSIRSEDSNITNDPVKSYSSKQISIIDPDINSRNEPQMVTEYLGDIFSYLRELETKFPIRKHFLDGHQSTPKMRAILVNWLVEVHMNFKLYLETLHLCVNIIDRYLQCNKNVSRDTLQLVGTSAMLVACKYEEMYLPGIEDFVYVCDDTYSKRQILQMEVDILKKLEFSLGRPLSVHFLRRYNKIAQVRSDHHVLGKYLLELALLEYEMSHIKPSIQAAAACCLSIGILNETMDLAKIWTPTLVHYTTYEYSDFRHVIIDLAHLITKSETSKHQTIKKKYAASSYAKISLNPKLHGPLVRKLTSMSVGKK